jgi:hypothetical protein
MAQILTPEIAQLFAETALGHLRREYPHKLDHVMNGPEDVRSPSDLHPIFYGSFDWHSCVHGYWMLLRLRRLFPEIPAAPQIDALREEMLTRDKVSGELAYLERPASASFERPYGWAWLLMLHREAPVLEPLALAFAERFKSYLPRLTYPIRVGTHFNTAFALILALSWADENDEELAGLIRSRAVDYYAGDQDAPAWEPGGDEFLSTTLIEALFMRQVLDDGAFRGWLDRFLPRLRQGSPETLFKPAQVSDRTDGKIAHLDGFNLSRVWCWRGIADALDPASADLAHSAVERHLAASLPHVVGDYMGEHWLATFALLALGAGGPAAGL